MTNVDSALVAGGGSIGRRHAENLDSLDIDVTVADPDADARERVATELDVPKVADFSTGIERVEPDLVVICAPNRFHVGLATEAASEGCHLFIEKPLSHKMTGVGKLATLVDEYDLVTLVGCNLRFHPEIRKMHELLQNDTIGPVVSARIEGGSYLPGWFPDSDYRDAYSAREELGGGVILDYIHEINYARWFFGEFETVSALAGQRTSLDIETNDVAGILAETAEGVLCEFHLDYIQREYSRSAHIIGEDGTIRWSWEGGVEWFNASSESWHTFERSSDWETNDMYINELEHFITCIEEDRLTTCPVDCGRRDLAVALAARNSAQTGCHITLT
jgi:predicted dehydrogenase